MNSLRMYACIFAGLICVLASTGTAGAAPYKCGKDASGTLNCLRVTSPARSGQSGTYADNSSGTMCKWKCSSNQGIETCKASGKECANKLPPHWR